MTTSARNPSVGPTLSARAVDVIVDETNLAARLEDGRWIIVPTVWFPRLVAATAEQRKNWKLISRGIGIHWPDLDEDISVENLLATSSGQLLAYRDGLADEQPKQPPSSKPVRPGKARRQNLAPRVARNAQTGRFERPATPPASRTVGGQPG